MSATDKDNAHNMEQCIKANEIESNHIVLELSKICRVCLLECNDLRSLFDEEPYCISDMIMAIVPIQVCKQKSKLKCTSYRYVQHTDRTVNGERLPTDTLCAKLLAVQHGFISPLMS